MTRKTKWLLLVATVGVVLGSLTFLAFFTNYRAAQVYNQQLMRMPSGPWQKESVAEAVVVRLGLGIGQQESDHEAIAVVGAELSQLLSGSSVGHFDGFECVRNRCALYLYGPDAEALFESVREVLRRSPITAQASVDLRLGPADLITVAKKGTP